MEKMTFIFLFIIAAYLFVTFLKSRKKSSAAHTKKYDQPKEAPAESADQVHAAIAAVLASIMGETAYVIKRVYPVASVDEKKSNWRTAGRIESMSKKLI